MATSSPLELKLKRKRVISSKGRVTRRGFLAGATAALAAPYFVPGSALGAEGATPASERITVGAIGTGGRGSADMVGIMRSPESQIVAVCDCRRPRLQSALRNVNNYYAKQTGRSTYEACKPYGDFRELLAREDVDAVIIGAPDHWHGVMATWAAKAGKSMYLEKPISRTIREGKVVCETVKRYGVVVQTGTQQRSDRKFRQACELAVNGYVGKVHTVEVAVPAGGAVPSEPPSPVPEGFDYDMWSGPAPLHPFDTKRCEWLAMYWIHDYCVGFICNWGVHHLDTAQWGCPELTSEPFELEAKAIFPKSGMCDTAMIWNAEFRYPSGLRMKVTSADNPWWAQGNPEWGQGVDFAALGKPLEQGCRFIGDEGWVHVNRQRITAEPASLLDVKIKPDETHLHASDNHYADFLESVRTGRDPVAPLRAGHAASTLGNLGDVAVRLERKIKWDPVAEQCGDEEANRMFAEPMRSPWTL